jgi:spore coat protein U-like protein
MRAMTRGRAFGMAIGLALWVGGVDSGGFAQRTQSCTIGGAGGIAFGSYDPMTSSGVDVQGQISYSCGKGGILRQPARGGGSVRGVPVEISLSPGLAGTFDRRMTGGRDVLRYNAYLDAAHQLIWGDGTGGTQTFTDSTSPNGQLVTLPVFGRLFSGQDVASGAYTDNLVVTLNF